jgi:2-polyprenyl-3-methyl-5-hydroxy-6-metoxy-1,4-benzoquinol methylase
MNEREREHGHEHDHEHQRHTDPAHEEFWNERYQSSARIWSGNPNPQLVAEVSGLAPGRALDVGCGEGADAIWLARQGWDVVATDISSVAIERATLHARETDPAAAARVEWRHVDLLSDAPERAAFDLVSAQFMQLAPEPRAQLFAVLAASVRARGALLVVGHHPSDMTSGVQRPPEPERFYSADDIAGLLDEDSWTIVVNESRPRSVTTPEGADATLHDAVFLAIRN